MASNGEPDLTGYSLEGYVFKRHLGSGAFGSVWLCEQPALDRYVAIKVLKREGAKARFLKEARLASKLDHPNAAHVYAFGVAEPPIGFWIAMEFVAGVTLDKWLEKLVRMTPEQFVPFFLALAEVVQAAHDRNIVHRDLKPSNVMVVEHRGRLVPKLLDLGIAREGVYPTTIADDRSAEFHAEDRVAIEALADVAPGGEGVVADVAPADDVDVAALPAAAAVQGEGAAAVDAVPRSTADAGHSARPPDLGETHRGVGAGAARGRLTPLGFRLGHLGTQHYMSPEQWANPSEVGHESDLYALGVIAFQCLVGRVPFHAEDSRDLHLMHLTRPVPSLGAAFSAEVDGVVARALAKAPSDRYATVVEFAEALASALRRLPQRQLTSRAQMWDDAGRPASLVLNRSELLHMEARSELERAFLTASHEHAARGVRRRLVLLTLATTCLTAVGAVALGSYLVLKAERAEQNARVANAVAENTVTQANLEQGRSELLHREPGAAKHLGKAYQRDPQPATAFMLSRALQPLLAEQARFASSFGRMWSAAFSPDDKEIITTDDKNAQIWDAQTHRLLSTLPHGDVVYHAAYSPDHQKVLTASGDGTVKIWEAASGALVRELHHDGNRPRYRAVAVHSDSRTVAAIDITGSVVHVWDLVSGNFLTELRCDGAKFPSIAFSHDGHWLAATGGNDVRVFDAQTWLQVVRIPNVRRMVWDPTGPKLFTGSVQGTATLWEIPSGKPLRVLRELGAPVGAVAFSVDGHLVVAAGEDGSEAVWDAKSGILQSRENHLGSRIRSVEFDATSTLLAAASSDGPVAVTEASTGALVSLLEGPRNMVIVAHFAFHSQRVVGASWDGTARVWTSSSPYRQWGSSATASACGVGLPGAEPDRRFLAVGCVGQPTRVWDTSHDRLLAELPSVTLNTDGTVSAAPVVSVEGDRAAVGRNNAVELYEVPSGKMLRLIKSSATVSVVSFATSGHDLVIGAVDGSLIVIRDNGAQLVLPPSSAAIDSAGFLSDGRILAVDALRHLRTYDATGATMGVAEVATRAGVLRMSASGDRLITVPRLDGAAGAPELWNLQSYRLVARLDVPEQGQVYGVRFVSGGRILTASGDGSVRLWDQADGRLYRRYEAGSRFLADCALSEDGTMVLAGGSDGLLRFWDLASGRPLWVIPAHKANLVGIHVDAEGIVTRGFSGEIVRWMLPKSEQIIERCSAHEQCATVFQ